MIRRLFPLLFLVAAALPLAGASAWADAVLRPSVVVDSDTIKLGDLFDNAGDKADTVVARAPAPGRRAVVDADWLRRVAINAGVRWVPDNPFVEAVIERAGATVGAGRIQDAVVAALVAQGVPKDSMVELNSGSSGVVVPLGSDQTVGVEGLYFDDMAQRFTATVVIPADSPTATRMQVNGRVFATIEVPVPARPIEHGELLAVRDLTFLKVRKDQLRADAVTDVDQVIGEAARQTLRAGDPISVNDLERPLAVTRGALIEVVLKTPDMLLTTQAKALDDGAIGDVVRVLNTRSNITVQGTVDGPGEVTVVPDGTLALAR